jgi:hypothetical protein
MPNQGFASPFTFPTTRRMARGLARIAALETPEHTYVGVSRRFVILGPNHRSTSIDCISDQGFDHYLHSPLLHAGTITCDGAPENLKWIQKYGAAYKKAIDYKKRLIQECKDDCAASSVFCAASTVYYDGYDTRKATLPSVSRETEAHH